MTAFSNGSKQGDVHFRTLFVRLQHLVHIINYSFRKDFTGLASAAFTAWKLMVSKATRAANRPATAKIHHGIPVRYAKSFSQLCMAYQAIGNAITAAIATNFKKSFDNNCTMLLVFAPNTFRMPISLIRCVIAKADKPNNPRQAIK